MDDSIDNFVTPSVLLPLQSIYNNTIRSIIQERRIGTILVSNTIWFFLVPMTSIIIVTSPVFVGMLLLLLPILLPILAILLVVFFATLSLFMVLYLSTRHGRNILSTRFGPVLSTFSHTSIGQHLFYNTGPLLSTSSIIQFIKRSILLSPSSSNNNNNNNNNSTSNNHNNHNSKAPTR